VTTLPAEGDRATVDHPADGQLVALARKYLLKHDRLTGTASLP